MENRTLPNPKQLQIAKDLSNRGVSIEWDSQVNSPVFIRGKGIGVLPVDGRRTAALVFNGTYSQRALAVLQNLSPLYGIVDPSQELAAFGSEQSDNLGFRHQTLKQVYRGIPVVGADLKVHFDKTATPYQISGRFIPGISLNPQPMITGDQAVASAKADFLRRGFSEPKIVEKPLLVIYALGLPPQLAYQLTLSDKPTNRYRFWVNASTGAVIQAINLVCFISPPTVNGKSATLQGSILPGEGGRVLTFAGWIENQTYYMYDPDNYYYVFNNSGTTDSPPFPGVFPAYPDAGTYAHRSTSNWGLSDPNEVSVAVNIAYTINYFKTVHGRLSADNKGTLIPAVAHYGENYVNAFWSGGDPGYMAFGDGDGKTATCLATLDICGHEVAHGVTQFSAALIYANESGALNESFSDIFGANVEFNFQNDDRTSYPNKKPGMADWLLGEDCWLSSKALRDMRSPANPATVGGNPQPSRYKGSYWYTGRGDNGGVHYNSGVQNFFYYLLSDGGKGTNDGISYDVKGISVQNARHLAYRTLTVYCTQSTDYKAVRRAWISAAEDLNPAWVPSVQAAWDAVGLVEPRVISPLSLTAVVNHPFTPYTIKVNDFPKSFQAAGLPPGLSLSGATITGVPTANGTFPVALTVTTASDVVTATLTITVKDPSPHDDFAQAKLLIPNPHLPISVDGTNTGYSKEIGEPAHGTGGPASSVWFKWIADQTGSVTFSTSGSNFDTILAAYVGTSLQGLAKIAANNDISSADKTSRIQFMARAGQAYYLALDGLGGQTGSYVLTATGALISRPANDNFASFLSLGSSPTVSVTDLLWAATAESGEPVLASLPPTRSVWFRWTAPSSGNLVLDTGGSDFANVFGIYTGTNLVSLKLLQGRASPAFVTNRITVPVQAGSNYVIKVDGAKSVNGSYRLQGRLLSVPAPSILVFTNLSTTTRQVPPRIAWATVPGASHYQVELLRSNILLRGITLNTSNWNNGPVLPRSNGFFARVRAFSNNLASDWAGPVPAVFP